MGNQIRLMLLALLCAPAVYAAPCEQAEYSHFDFLIGDWVVHSLDGKLQGENTISREENGCLLVERWQGAQGSTGQSYNYYHVGKKQWHQLWVSGGAVIDYWGGLNDAGAMHLEGDIFYQANGNTARFAGTWTPNEDGSVLQELKQWDADKGTWADWFTGVYTRRQ